MLLLTSHTGLTITASSGFVTARPPQREQNAWTKPCSPSYKARRTGNSHCYNWGH